MNKRQAKIKALWIAYLLVDTHFLDEVEDADDEEKIAKEIQKISDSLFRRYLRLKEKDE